MRAVVQVISERTDSYTGKRGLVKNQIIACLDSDPEHPFINTFDYVLSDEEVQKHSGKIQGKRVELAITNMEAAYGGRLRARGSIIKVLGASAAS